MNEIDQPLSKWWQTTSAQAAFRRAEKVKKEKIRVMRERIAQRKAELDKAVWEESK